MCVCVCVCVKTCACSSGDARVCVYVGVYMCVYPQSLCTSPGPQEEIFVSKTFWILFIALRSGGQPVNSVLRLFQGT